MIIFSHCKFEKMGNCTEPSNFNKYHERNNFSVAEYRGKYIAEHRQELQVQTCYSGLGKHYINNGIVQIKCLNRLTLLTLIVFHPGILWIKSCRGKEKWDEQTFLLSEDSKYSIYEVLCITRTTYKKKIKEEPNYFKTLRQQRPNTLLVIADVAEEFIYSSDKGYRKIKD